ncbi:uncharacterized protein EV154DRAFT_490449 [Mucor mucedo]|uniref:uncharacterized protein n=1 Tax=Mucor mucedo TaxID=29922 RepID=UPI00221FC627|nr:uncharacterized protein EV154DRAFT_490449 [Mucor mucedo]KAI7897092.1 hypothetical protein EV154DRAFT_490449 [Mucor mucedo]
MTNMTDMLNSRGQRYNVNDAPSNNATTTATSADCSFENEFKKHQNAIHLGHLEEALQSFVLLQANNAENEKFEAYIIQFSDHIDPSKNTDISTFFASLPALIQSTIIEKIAASLEKKDTLRAYQTLFDYIQNYSRHAYKYLIRAIKLLVLGAQNMSQLESKKYIKILVTELFPRLCKQRILLTHKDIPPAVKSTEGKQYISIPYNLFEQYLVLGQQFYIEHRDWIELSNFTNAMLDCCGYTRLGQIGFQSHINKFQYMQEKRCGVRIDPNSIGSNDLAISIVLMCEFKAVAVEFIQFCNEYYRAVCTLDSPAGQDKSCLIPICAIKPALTNNTSGRQFFNDTTTAIQPEDYNSFTSSNGEEDDDKEDKDYRLNSNNKRDRPVPSSSRSDCPVNNSHDAHLYPYQRHHVNKRQKVQLPDRGGEGLESYCMGGVDSALQILSKAADCMRHIVELWDWAFQMSPDGLWDEIYGDWEQELVRVIDAYQLPFDLTNAVLLVRSDMALSSPSVAGNLAKALELSQLICDRIEVHRQKYKKEENDITPPEFDIPFMFAFRVLYNIGVIYLLVGSLPQSTLEIAIILSVFPVPNDLDDTNFLADEVDCRTVATIFQDHEFGLMRVTQEGLVVRCIKHLIVSLDNDSSHKSSMASIDSALRWDEKAGQMIVLMQYGWNYWSTRTNLWNKIVTRMKEKKLFKNRVFLEYIYVSEILQTFQHLHNYSQVTLDIIPPEFAMRSGYRYFGLGKQPASLPSRINMVSHIEIEENPQSIKLPSLSSITSQQSTLPPPSIYQPSYSNTILPSMTMSPTWYSSSTQKNSHVNWMSPSFYYSRPATSVMLPKDDREGDQDTSSVVETDQSRAVSVPTDIVVRCLEYRMRKYSPKMTPQRMRQVLQRFLKSMLLKANTAS